VRPDDIAYQILRWSGGLVLLAMSVWKLVVTDYWIGLYMPSDGTISSVILFSTALLGLFLGSFLLLDLRVQRVALVTFALLFATMGLLVVQLSEPLIEPLIRDLGLLALYAALVFMADGREPDGLISIYIDR